MPTTTSTAVTAMDLHKTYATGRGKPPVPALDGLSLDIGAGTVFALLGPNGAGKSTTVRILATLARPDSGQVTVAGVDALRHPDKVRRLIGLVPQKSCSDPLATGRENLLLAGLIQGMTRPAARTRAADLLARFDLADAADRLAGKYSGGMARKLDVAIGLMHRPRVLFLDEPTTGLDPQARTHMWAEISRMSAEEEMTVVITTHYLEEADQLADQLAIVDHGRVVVQGTPDDLKSELRGDTIQIELPGPDAATRAAELLSPVGGLHTVTVEASTLRARTDDGARGVPTVLAALEAGGLQITSITVARPSLDDVYLRHAGRSFDAAGTGSAMAAHSVEVAA